ncbi:MAG: thermonuclease family protein [Marivivens sp.]|uniref:thermonuclease family protein n=1 Tax=Marivivens sp. TaxID=1978374 RepID=UPI001800ACD6|nr:thermonuclease family protein [Marivivens sp.]NVJ94675.1 thermonuclease family protein [Marivivens sp.]
MEVFVILALIVGGLYVVITHRPGASPAKPQPTFKPAEEQAPPRPTPFDASSAVSEPRPQIIKGLAYVVDGDTLVINQNQIRLFGVDAPEYGHPYGKSAKYKLMALCKGEQVTAEVTDTDSHGRKVARCSLAYGRDLSAEMVKLGLALDWAKFSGGRYAHLEVEGIRRKLWLADARQKGRMHVWEKYEATKAARKTQ